MTTEQQLKIAFDAGRKIMYDAFSDGQHWDYYYYSFEQWIGQKYMDIYPMDSDEFRTYCFENTVGQSEEDLYKEYIESKGIHIKK